MAGRTLLQQAAPTTFGAVAAGWGAGLDRAAAWLARVRDGTLAVQLGGAAGTLAALHPDGLAVLAAFAEQTGLAEPDAVWHTERTRVAELACALGAACGALGKAATDVVLLAQTELGEVREAAGGGSSSMPHKQNPIAAVTARAAAAQAPGLVATLLAAMPAELQRGAGPWHAEWQPLAALLRVTGGAAARLRVCLAGLVVDAAAMARNLAAGPAAGGNPGHAADLVDRYLSRRPR
jgi:3-carboxy-cis,cis-muconate cycloisomerase